MFSPLFYGTEETSLKIGKLLRKTSMPKARRCNLAVLMNREETCFGGRLWVRGYGPKSRLGIDSPPSGVIELERFLLERLRKIAVLILLDR